MTKNAIIAVLATLLFWFGAALVRIENERYALLLDVFLVRRHCLFRTAQAFRPAPVWAWHLVYALGIL